jgi:hypothetical protein
VGRQGVGRLLRAKIEAERSAQESTKVYVDTSSTFGYDSSRVFYEKSAIVLPAFSMIFFGTAMTR